MSARGERLFAEYAAAHSTRGNRVCHSIGIPMIVASVVLALVTVRLAGAATAAEVVIAAVIAAELFLDASMALVFLLFLAMSDAAARAIAASAGAGAARLGAAALFLLGWAFQFLGHWRYEHNRPAFARNLIHLLVGPLWIARKLLASGRAGQPIT